MKRIKMLLVLFLIAISCSSPSSKENYLEDYEVLIEVVSEKYMHLKGDDWNDYDEQYGKFRNEWYEKFEEEFTLEEKLKIGGLSAKYLYCRNIASELDEYLLRINQEFDLFKKDIQEYIDNDMEEEIQHLIDISKELGEKEFEKVKKALQELDYEIIDEGEDAPPAI